MPVGTPTPEEIAQYEAAVGGAAPAAVNPLKDFSAEDIAALAVEDKNNFIIADEFQRQKELHADPAIVQKVADALNIVKQRGFKLADLPTVPEAGKAVATAGKGLLKQLWNYSSVPFNVGAGAVSELVGAEGLAQGFAENINQQLSSNIAGTEESMTGLSQLAGKGVGKLARTTGISKDFSEYTPAERVTDLFDEAGKSEVRTERLSGKGEFSKTVTGGESETAGVKPEEVATLAAGDPLSFFIFGRAASLAGQSIRAVTPTVVKGAISAGTRAVEQAAEKALPAAGGGALTAAAVTAKGAAKVVEKVAPIATPVYGAIEGAARFGPAGALAGLTGGRSIGKALARGAGRAAGTAEKVADVGRQIAGSEPIKSAYAQAGRDFLQALPGAVGEVAKGTALDVGLAAVTAELPQDTQSSVGFGTAIGAFGGAKRVAGRVLSGQLIGPRDYSISAVVPSSGQFPGFDSMHADAMKAAEPGVRARLNAIREFTKGAAPDTDVFLARDSAAAERALIDAGLPPETARQWAAQSGFISTSIPGKNGTRRQVAIVRDVEAAPHEAFHAVQDVIGEGGNQQIDSIIREAYGAQWEAEGQRYADRLSPGAKKTWRETILDASGWGLLEAKEKIYRDIANRIEGETGAAPSPRLVEEMAKAELGRRMDEAISRGQDLDPNEVGQHVWRDVLSPEDVTAVSDRYIAREIAAENFDAIFKNQGPRLEEGKQLPQQLARIVGGLVTAFGGDPLAGRVSEFGGVQLRAPVVEAVRKAARGLKPEVQPTAPARTTPRAPQGSPEGIAASAEEARAIAAEAPGEIQAGGTRSPRELLGEVAEAIATQSGIKLNYLSAPGEPAAATTSNRTTRRAIIETFRTMPAAARALWEKTFFPDRILRTKGGKYQVQGWAPEVFAANAHKLAEFLADLPDAQTLSPYAIDAATRSFTSEAWQQLYVDTQTFVQNQSRGATGAGEPLVVPKSATDAGAFKPPTRPGAVGLDQGKADFINLLFNFKLPETPRIQAGKRPLNILGQEVSAATKPGRVEMPVRPRGDFTGEEAVRQGIEGRSILEVNPLRNQLEAVAQAAGKPVPSMIEVIQKLNLESIVEVQGTLESPQFRGNTLTLTAGFQAPKAGERQWRVSGQLRGAKKEITVTAADIAAARKQAESQGMRVAGVEAADKMANAMFQPDPVALADQVEKFSPAQFRDWVNSIKGNFTQAAWDVGRAAPDRAFAEGLKTRYDALSKKSTEQMANIRAGDPATLMDRLNDVSALASQAQFFREAYEAATGTASAGNALRLRDPSYQPPFPPETPTAQAQPERQSEFKLRPGTAGGFSKAWILPSGEPVQIGGKWHHQWLSENPEVTAKYGLDIPAFAGTDVESVRESALKAGFARVVYTQRSGSLTVEARAKDWRKIKPAIEKLAEENIEKIDNMKVTLFDDNAGEVIDSQSKQLFNFDTDAEKLANLPLPSGEPRARARITDRPDFFEPPAQYQAGKRTEDAAFKRWFKESKAVSESGAPLRLFHGTTQDISQFRESRLGVTSTLFGSTEVPRYGVFLTEDPKLAGAFVGKDAGANLVPLYLRAENPLDLRKPFSEEFLTEFSKLAEEDDGKGAEFANFIERFAGTEVAWELFDGDVNEPGRMIRVFKKMGYDSARIFEPEREGIVGEAWVAFDPNQVKSAVGNAGGFDESARIQFQPEGELLSVPKDERNLQRTLKSQVNESREKYPEAIPLDIRKDDDGNFKINAKGEPIYVGVGYDLDATPLAKSAAKSKRNPEARDAAITKAYADKIKSAYAEAAKNPEIAAGANWYSLAREKLSKLLGEDTKFFTELLGATSAQTPVDTNFKFAVDAYNNFKAGKYDEQIQKYREGKAIWEFGDLGLEEGETPRAQLFEEAGLGPKPTRAAFLNWWIAKHDLKPRQSNGKFFGANSDAVMRVLDGSWREEVQGPKTPNFAGNLSGDSFESTVDIWAARLLHRLGNEGNPKRWRILPKNETGVSDSDFFLGQRAFRKAGDELGISPDSLQAIMWFFEKDVWMKKGWAGTGSVGAAKSDFNTLLDVTERTYSEKGGPGKIRIFESDLKKPAQKTDKAQLDFELE